ncbi:MAG: S8 family peptidase [Bacteroidales bacterium]
MGILISGILFAASSTLPAQQLADGAFWVYFKDKAGNGFTVNQPSAFLAERSIQRRAWQGLSVDSRDLPVTSAYLSQLKALGVEIRHVSRWLNGVAMVNADSQLFSQVLELDFTDTVAWQPDPGNTYSPSNNGGERFGPPVVDQPPAFDYGYSLEQAAMLGMDHLHELGYTGKGVWIAVLDAGFSQVDSLPSFQTMISEGRLIGTRNFVHAGNVMREHSSHGMNVLSSMAGNWPGNLIGTAPDASYYLCMTEDPDRETKIEEIAWIEAAEFVDSLGFDVINTSLGYSDFDSTAFDYTYADMDGKTTYISRAASLAASRGMIACNSAGNEGSGPWFYITAPADATDILTVGAVDREGTITGFSSRGPTYDSRVKPDVVAQGSLCVLQGVGGGLVQGSGTSFSSPILAGSVASLWQAYPEVSAAEMIRWVRQSGDRRLNPDVTYGFGIPAMARAYWNITHVPAGLKAGKLELYPNPAGSWIRVRLPGEESGYHEIRVYDMSGRTVMVREADLSTEILLPSSLQRGIYLMEIRTERGTYRGRFIKQ